MKASIIIASAFVATVSALPKQKDVDMIVPEIPGGVNYYDPAPNSPHFFANLQYASHPEYKPVKVNKNNLTFVLDEKTMQFKNGIKLEKEDITTVNMPAGSKIQDLDLKNDPFFWAHKEEKNKRDEDYSNAHEDDYLRPDGTYPPPGRVRRDQDFKKVQGAVFAKVNFGPAVCIDCDIEYKINVCSTCACENCSHSAMPKTTLSSPAYSTNTPMQSTSTNLVTQTKTITIACSTCSQSSTTSVATTVTPVISAPIESSTPVSATPASAPSAQAPSPSPAPTSAPATISTPASVGPMSQISDGQVQAPFSAPASTASAIATSPAPITPAPVAASPIPASAAPASSAAAPSSPAPHSSTAPAPASVPASESSAAPAAVQPVSTPATTFKPAPASTSKALFVSQISDHQPQAPISAPASSGSLIAPSVFFPNATISTESQTLAPKIPSKTATMKSAAPTAQVSEGVFNGNAFAVGASSGLALVVAAVAAMYV